MNFFIISQFLQHTLAHQAVVGVVKHNVHTHPFHHMIKTFCCRFLKERVLFPAASHSVNDIISGFKFFQHLVDRIDIILKIRIQCNRHIAMFFRIHQPRKHRILVPPVTGKGQSAADHIFPMKFADQYPRLIFGTVIDIKDPAFFMDHSALHQRCHLFQKLPVRLRKHFLLIVARHHKIQGTFFVHSFPPSPRIVTYFYCTYRA